MQFLDVWFIATVFFSDTICAGYLKRNRTLHYLDETLSGLCLSAVNKIHGSFLDKQFSWKVILNIIDLLLLLLIDMKFTQISEVIFLQKMNSKAQIKVN